MSRGQSVVHPSVVVDKGIIITVCAHEMMMICAKEALEKKVPAIENIL